MKPLTLCKTSTAVAVVCLGVIVASWLANADVVIGQLGDSPDWTVVLVPRGYFLFLYILEAGAILGALWFWRISRRKPANKAPHATAATPGT